MDGSYVLWSLPRDLPPLVRPPFVEKGLKLGVGGRYLSECVAHQRGYMIHDDNGTLEIRIPFGAEGGFLKVPKTEAAGLVCHFLYMTKILCKHFRASNLFNKPSLLQSHVSDGRYFQSYFVDLFLLREWEDAAWSLTRQRTFRALSIRHLLRPITLIDSELMFTMMCFFFRH